MAGVGIVVVSHSRDLAAAAVALAREMAPPEAVRIEIAAGTDDGFGTDAGAIAEAITAVDGPDGVVVLMDLGSAVLSAELALEFVEPETAARTTLCPAPIVEGLVVAAVSAAGGASRDEVSREASDALAGKLSQLGGSAEADETPEAVVQDAPGSGRATVTGTFVVVNAHGLHARPAARLVSEVRGFDAEVSLRNVTTGAGPVSGASLSRVATLGALPGHEVAIEASGPDAAAAVEALEALAAEGFGEGPGEQDGDDAPPGPAVLVGEPARALTPTGASPGIAIGPARLVGRTEVVLPEAIEEIDRSAGKPADEQRALDDALAAARAEITATRDQMSVRGSPAEAEIFDAHLALLDDPALCEEAARRIADGATAATAWHAVSAAAADELRAVGDEYIAGRADDIDAVRDQVVSHLLGRGGAGLALAVDGVLVAAELTPAQAAGLDPARVVGVLTSGGSPTAHSSILLRSLGIPAVVGAGSSVLDVADGATIALDGSSGEFVIDPSDDALTEWSERRAAADARAVEEKAAASEPATTADGVEVIVAANAGSAADVARAVANGADAIGLVRTEFVFLDRTEAPTVDEQVETYREILAAADGRRVTLRTLDVGGDKPLSYLRQEPEANPFLGLRGIRLAFAHEQLLRDQLTAIVTVAREAPVSVMFPMVATLDEFRRARAVLVEVAGSRGLPSDLHVGVMVEIPALALRAATLAPEVDFFSIGTNDLTQYALAVERGNPSVAALADALDPGVLQLISSVCAGAATVSDRDVLVAVCGELASDPVAAPLLVGLGVRELSVAAPAVPAIKAVVRAIDASTAADLARAACRAESAEVVRDVGPA